MRRVASQESMVVGPLEKGGNGNGELRESKVRDVSNLVVNESSRVILYCNPNL